MMVRMVLVVIALATPAVAVAQSGTSALKGLDTGAPIDVDANRIEIRDASNQAIFTGEVVIKQARLTLNAERVTVSYVRQGENPEMRRLDARGAVKLVSPSETVTSTSAIYDVPGRLITMVGNVVLNRQGSVLNGQRLVLDLASGRTSFDGRSAANQGGRVSGRFLVPDKK
ncbi:LptA/OstA family protein [Polymorphobacter sp.]|uniref:LptA/OstA family protein n=1 Tax=Polymorphobacter sp. TaxID=1909290 RepID=UPI003F7218CD